MVQGVKVNLPETQSKVLPLDQEEPLIISIDSNGAVYLEVDSFKDQSINSFKRDSRKDYLANPDIQVVVRGDSEVKYEKVMDLMSILQSAGAEGVGLITKPPKGK